MSRPTLVAALVCLALAGGAAWFFLARQEDGAEEARQERREERARERERAERETREENERAAEALRAASVGKFPPPLEDLTLGITKERLTELRPQARPRSERRPGPGDWMEEKLPNGAEILYGFEETSERLRQVQVLSMVPPRGIEPHLTALVERYGSPTGVWHCPASGAAGVPTRRFTWRMEDIGIQDIILVHPRGVSLTLYIAADQAIAQSLRLSSCRPVRSREEMADLPIATPEQLEAPLSEAQ